MRKGLLLLAIALAMTTTSILSPAGASPRGDDLQRRGNIRIVSNSEFDSAHGIRGGSGTAKDPYVISGWDVARIEIKDTSKHVVIRNNRISTLVLDWIGHGAHVVNNEVGDLRVNQNVRRTGDMTSGVIAHNRFRVVGQLRHWDGVFEHNQVGDPSSCMDIPFVLCRGVNFDGFNGAKFRHNNVYGYVEVRLHGHHHSSSFSDHSHYHGTDHADMTDHTQRFHQVWVTNNTIHSGEHYGLLYTDSNHRGNDRTATSETNPDLNLPHVHSTKVHFVGNKIFGDGIDINIFNARDERHTGTRTGVMNIKNNVIHVQAKETRVEDTLTTTDGITVSQAQDVKLSITGNKIDGAFSEADMTSDVDEFFDNGSGIYLSSIDKARVFILDNRVKDRIYGVEARQMGSSVRWWIGGLKTSGVRQDVYYDSSVANEPKQKE